MNRPLTTTFALILALAAGGGGAHAQSHAAQDLAPSIRDVTPEEWSRRAAHVPRCDISTEPAHDGDLILQPWHVESLEGTIALPRGFTLRTGSGSGRRGYQWIGPDSSAISLNGSWALGGLAMSGGKLVHGMSTCAAELFGRKVPAQEFEMLMSANGDTAYFSSPGTVVKKGQGLQIMIQARSAERRAQLLEYAESMQLTGASARY